MCWGFTQTPQRIFTEKACLLFLFVCLSKGIQNILGFLPKSPCTSTERKGRMSNRKYLEFLIVWENHHGFLENQHRRGKVQEYPIRQHVRVSSVLWSNFLLWSYGPPAVFLQWVLVLNEDRELISIYLSPPFSFALGCLDTLAFFFRNFFFLCLETFCFAFPNSL